MSVTAMSAVFQTEFRDLKDEDGNVTKASTAKLVLLAMADCANEFGEGIYPSIQTLSKKCALSEQTIRNTFSALLYNGIIFRVGESEYKTHNHKINMECFPQSKNKRDFPELVAWVKPVEGSNGLGDGSNELGDGVNPVDPNHTININEPSYCANAQNSLKTDELPVDWQIGQGMEKIALPDTDTAQRKDAAMLIATGMGVRANDAFELAFAFQDERKITFTNEQVKGQRKAVKFMLEKKITPEHVRAAVRKMAEINFTCTTLFHIQTVAEEIANPATPVTASRREFSKAQEEEEVYVPRPDGLRPNLV